MTGDHHPHRQPAESWEITKEKMRHEIARKLGIEADRIRHHDPGHPSDIGVTGSRWQIFYRDEWRDMPWHFDGPLSVTRELVRAKLGVAENTSEPPKGEA